MLRLREHRSSSADGCKYRWRLRVWKPGTRPKISFGFRVQGRRFARTGLLDNEACCKRVQGIGYRD